MIYPASIPACAAIEMTPLNELELRGDLRTNPLAELLVEISNARLTGSLRISKGERKSIIYLKNGTVLFAVSNAREHRLFSQLLIQKKIGSDALKKFTNPANDHELASWLKDQQILPASEVNFAIIRQIETVIADGLSWQNGDWVFDPLTRARDEMKVAIDVFKLVMEHARNLSEELVGRLFKPSGESFTPVPNRGSKIVLLPTEKYMLDGFGDTRLSLEVIQHSCPVPEADLRRSLYVLWLAGLIERHASKPALAGAKVDVLKSTKFSLATKWEPSKEAKAADISIFADNRTPAQRDAARSNSEQPVVPDLASFLERVEEASTFYEILGVAKTASTDQIKKAYLTNAQSFHPDKFHREPPEMLRRIHHAFSEIARAHETLKTESSRNAYDVKIEKQAEIKRRAPMVTVGENETQAGVESFESGLHALEGENYAEAATHFSRAVHSCPQSARFHAYFGKALSGADQYQHKAENEFQTAVRLAPSNVEIRMMYIDFLIDLDMIKRAEGELNRFLEIAPGNTGALSRLAKLH